MSTSGWRVARHGHDACRRWATHMWMRLVFVLQGRAGTAISRWLCSPVPYSSPCGVRGKKHLKVRCHSVCRRSSGYCAASYGAAFTPSSAFCPGRHGDAGISAAPSSATTSDAAAYLVLCYIYGCSTKFGFSKDDIFNWLRLQAALDADLHPIEHAGREAAGRNLTLPRSGSSYYM